MPPTQDALKLRLNGQKVVHQNNLSNVPDASEGYAHERVNIENGKTPSLDDFKSLPQHVASPIAQSSGQQPQRLPPMPQYDEDDEESEISQVSDNSIYDPAKYKGPTVKQEKAHREAMDRYLTEMEIRASEAIAV